MTKKELIYIDKVLERIKEPDQFVERARVYIQKDLKVYASRKGQIKEMYEIDSYWGGS